MPDARVDLDALAQYFERWAKEAESEYPGPAAEHRITATALRLLKLVREYAESDIAAEALECRDGFWSVSPCAVRASCVALLRQATVK